MDDSFEKLLNIYIMCILNCILMSFIFILVVLSLSLYGCYLGSISQIIPKGLPDKTKVIIIICM